MNLGWRKNYLRQKGYFLDMMRKYRERADLKAYLEILLSLLTISIFAIFALRPTLLTIAELLKQIDGRKEILTKMNGKIANLSKAQILYDQQRENISLLQTALPNYPKPDIISRQVEGSAYTNKVDIVSFSLEESPLKGSPTLKGGTKNSEGSAPENSVAFATNFSVALENYKSIETLINNFENLRLPLIVNSLSLNTSKSNDEQILLLSISGSFPYFMPKTE